MPYDEGGGIGAEPEDGSGDLLGLAHPSDRFLRDDPFAALVGAAGEAVHHAGVDDAGADGIDADARLGGVEGGGFGEADHAVLGAV